MTKRVLVPLAAGFEEIEAVTVVDVLRRADVDVTVAALDERRVEGSHGMVLEADRLMDDVVDETFDLVVLPGGMPGAQNLHDDVRVRSVLERVRESGGMAAAICAAPMALNPTGWAAERSVTSYPSFEGKVECARYLQDRVVIDDRLVTSRGPGTALEFALTLVRELSGEEAARGLAKAMLVAPGEEPRIVR